MLFSIMPALAHPDAALRPIENGDLEVWAAYLMAPQVYEHTSWNLSAPSELKPFLWSSQTHSNDSLFRLAIVCRGTDRLIGTIGFHTVSSVNKSAELSYDLSPEYWGKGVASMAANSLTTWAHDHAGVVRVQATVLESNARSMRVLERCGFLREGLLRSYRQVRGKPGDFWIYSNIKPAPSAS